MARDLVWRFASLSHDIQGTGTTVQNWSLNPEGDTDGWTVTRIIGRIGVFGFSDAQGLRFGRVFWGLLESGSVSTDPVSTNANVRDHAWLGWGVLVTWRQTDGGVTLEHSVPHEFDRFDVRGQNIMTNSSGPTLVYRAADDMASWTDFVVWAHFRTLYKEPA